MQSEFEIGPGKVIRAFTPSETKELHKQWMEVFCKAKTGLNAKAYRWHIFSGGGYPSVSGEEAKRHYSVQVATDFIVLPNDQERAVLTDARPEWCSLKDYCVFPRNLAWVMAFTHEDGWLGPYFALHPKYQELNAENLSQHKKLQQKEFARSQGWYKG